MDKVIIFILFLFLLISCNERETRYIVDKHLAIIEHRTGATTKSLAISDFSIAKGYEVYYDTIQLKKCYCNLYEDTLHISIGYPSEVVQSATFLVSNGDYRSFVTFDSDVPAYYGEHSMIVKTDTEMLTLNRSDYVVSDTLLGKFHLKTDTVHMSMFSSIDRPVEFTGTFQCIIQDRKYE